MASKGWSKGKNGKMQPPKAGGGGVATAEASDEQALRDAGVSGLELQTDLSTLQKLNPQNAADSAYREALLTPRSRMPDQGSSLDRVFNLRRLSNRNRLTPNDIREAADTFRQGLRGGNGSASNLAALEYTNQIYNRLTPSGRNVFAQALSTGLPPDSRLQSNPRFARMMSDIQSRRARLGDPITRISRGRLRRLSSQSGGNDDDPFA